MRDIQGRHETQEISRSETTNALIIKACLIIIVIRGALNNFKQNILIYLQCGGDATYFKSSSVKGMEEVGYSQSCPTLCDPMNRSTPGLPVHPNSQSSLKLTSIESVMPSSHLILCRPLLLLPPIPPSIRVFWK